MTRDRIEALDLIRGVAVMGILAMNIVNFGLPDTAYANPMAYGTDGWADWAAWLIGFVLVDGKMRGLFSFLFGASMLLVIDRAKASGENSLRVHLARMVWLFAFGVAHLFLLWGGDVLQLYAMVGVLAYPLRRAAVHRLLTLAAMLIALTFAMQVLEADGARARTRAVAAGTAGAATIRAAKDFDEAYGRPPQAYIDGQLRTYRGGYATIVAARATDGLRGMLFSLIVNGPETLAFMLLGMAGLRSGLLTGAWPRAQYHRWATVGFGLGIPTYLALAMGIAANGYAAWAVDYFGEALPTLARPPMIAGWAALVLLLGRPGGAMTARVSAAGRMAFSNYLLTSLVCTTIFYGYGMGLFGRLSRAQLYLVVVPVWAAMLLWSPAWLARFRYGPLEWLWRSLARARLQPMLGPAR